MSETISRMYGSHDRAMSAVSELMEHGWGDADIFVVVPPASGGSVDEIAATIMKGRVLRYHAKIYAEGVRRGGTLVTVSAPFATSTTAKAILDSHEPIESGVSEPAGDYLTWDDAAPFSSSLRVPVLTDPKASLSEFLSMSILTKGRASIWARLGIPELSSPAAAFSRAVGIPMISRNPAPLSSLLHLPVLTRFRR